MTTRAIFNRQYTDYTPGGQQVWLLNGAGVTTTPINTLTFTAGDTLVQGQVVYVSGTYVLPATAASGVSIDRYNAIGITTEAAAASASVSVSVDDTVVVSSANLTADTQLVPGQYYYLSKFDGQLTAYVTASGSVTSSGGYGALVGIGQALSPTELQVEIEAPLYL
jgi:hypothetical protein